MPGVSPASLTLPPSVQSVRKARHFLRDACEAQGVPAEVLDDAALLTSELVSNAVLHGRSEIRLVVERRSRRLRVSVHDENSRRPMLVPDAPDALDGRGLALVAGIASSWGVHDEPIGKAVWFELELP